jgi:hypothetical protein
VVRHGGMEFGIAERLSRTGRLLFVWSPERPIPSRSSCTACDPQALLID